MTAYASDDPDSTDDLVALFSSEEGQSPAANGADTPDPTDTAAVPADDGSYANALYGEAPAQPADTPRDIDAVTSPAENAAIGGGDEAIPGLSTVTNPALTVSVSAMQGGATQRVDLSPELSGVTESRLADEICALADLARLKGQAGMLTGMLADPRLAERGRELELDPRESIPGFFDKIGMPLATPEQADAARAEVFATLYAPDN
jgi:hypothetical protein